MKKLYQSLLGLIRPRRFLQLVLTVFALLMLQSVTEDRLLPGLLLSFVLLNAVFVAASASPSRRTILAILISLWSLQAGMAMLPLHVEEGTSILIKAVALGIAAVITFLCAGLILHYVLRRQSISMDLVFAAVVSYLLIALAFAKIYELMSLVSPGSIAGIGSAAAELVATPGTTTNYFSFVTLTTLGFGDITPQTGLARMIVSIEAATGQIYVAVVIAWLVGKVSRSQASAPPSE